MLGDSRFLNLEVENDTLYRNVCKEIPPYWHNGVNLLRHLALKEKKHNGSSRLDVVEITHILDMLPKLFPS